MKESAREVAEKIIWGEDGRPEDEADDIDSARFDEDYDGRQILICYRWLGGSRPVEFVWALGERAKAE